MGRPREWSDTRTRAIGRQVRVAAVSAVTGVALPATGVVLTWLAPAAGGRPGPLVTAVRDDGGSACGELVAAEDGRLTVLTTRDGRRSVWSADVARIVRLSPVAAC